VPVNIYLSPYDIYGGVVKKKQKHQVVTGSKSKADRLKPLSLYPLTPEEALSAFMRTDPKKMKAAKRKAQTKNKK